MLLTLFFGLFSTNLRVQINAWSSPYEQSEMSLSLQKPYSLNPPKVSGILSSFFGNGTRKLGIRQAVFERKDIRGSPAV